MSNGIFKFVQINMKHLLYCVALGVLSLLHGTMGWSVIMGFPGETHLHFGKFRKDCFCTL